MLERRVSYNLGETSIVERACLSSGHATTTVVSKYFQIVLPTDTRSSIPSFLTYTINISSQVATIPSTVSTHPQPLPRRAPSVVCEYGRLNCKQRWCGIDRRAGFEACVLQSIDHGNAKAEEQLRGAFFPQHGGCKVSISTILVYYDEKEV